jgi:DMSO/TMAO reductase YedYZ heme-binding membrane subunit
VLRSAQLIAGLSALAVLTLLLLTSFAAVITRLRLRYWKELHRLSYAAALLVAQHVLLAPFAGRWLALALLAAVAALLAVRVVLRGGGRGEA